MYIFLLAFKQCLCVGELVVKLIGKGSITIQREDISFEFNNTNSLDAVLNVLRHFIESKF